jgi:hypothetical protein
VGQLKGKRRKAKKKERKEKRKVKKGKKTKFQKNGKSGTEGRLASSLWRAQTGEQLGAYVVESDDISDM